MELVRFEVATFSHSFIEALEAGNFHPISFQDIVIATVVEGQVNPAGWRQIAIVLTATGALAAGIAKEAGVELAGKEIAEWISDNFGACHGLIVYDSTTSRDYIEFRDGKPIHEEHLLNKIHKSCQKLDAKKEKLVRGHSH